MRRMGRGLGSYPWQVLGPVQSDRCMPVDTDASVRAPWPSPPRPPSWLELDPKPAVPRDNRSLEGLCHVLGIVPKQPRSPSLWLAGWLGQGSGWVMRQCLLSHQAKSVVKCAFGKGSGGEQYRDPAWTSGGDCSGEGFYPMACDLEGFSPHCRTSPELRALPELGPCLPGGVQRRQPPEL